MTDLDVNTTPHTSLHSSPGPFVSARHVEMRANAIQRLTDALKSEHSHANLACPRE